MKLDAPKNNNYAAVIVEVGTVVDLPGLDNLVGVPVLGHQALTTRGVQRGELRVAFTAETQLSDEYARFNNLYRDSTLNQVHEEKGYLEKSRRIRAMKMRGHVSNALLMPLNSLAFTGVDTSQLKAGDTFDTLGGYPICNKYEIAPKKQPGAASKVAKAFKRVTTKQFPEHLDTDNYFRSKHLLNPDAEVIVTQKLHGTSFRAGNVPVLRKLTWLERVAKRLGVRVDTYEYDVVFGSRKVIKDVNNPNQNHYYSTDIWTEYGRQIQELIPEGYIIYGELIGWTPNGAEIQKNYTYDVPRGEVELYVYRVATVNRHGVMADLSWTGVKEFCRARGLKWVPELDRGSVVAEDGFNLLDSLLGVVKDRRISTVLCDWNESPVTVSNGKTVDEGVCIRQEGLVPLILKAKSPLFLEHETKMLDQATADDYELAG